MASPLQMTRFVIPRDTAAFCSMDWGFNAPGVVLWWAHVGDGHWHIVRELKFQHETADTVAQRWKGVMNELGIKRVAYVAADPSMWAKTGHGRGESIAETLQRHGLPMLRADNDRKNGWQRCHELLRMAPDGRPWLTVDASCVYGLRSLPAQVSDRHDPDDVNTTGDDHWVDAWRYGAMSRFVAGNRKAPKTPPPPMSVAAIKAASQPVPGILGRRVA